MSTRTVPTEHKYQVVTRFCVYNEHELMNPSVSSTSEQAQKYFLNPLTFECSSCEAMYLALSA